jgi:hypothetical protein
MKLSSYLNQKNDKYELSFLQIRRAVGILGIALPVVLSLGTWWIGSCPHLKDSISDYYYTIMGTEQVGILCAVALFLFSYKGFDKRDKISSSIAGLGALGVAFFPDNDGAPRAKSCPYCNILQRDFSHWRDNVHSVSAVLFFIMLAYMALFLFTKWDTKKGKTAEKVWRNGVYKICGIVILATLVLMGGVRINLFDSAKSPYHPLFWLESLGLWAFGISWLVKGETLLKDGSFKKTGKHSKLK